MTSIEKIQIKNFKTHKDYSIEINKKYKHVVIYGYNGVGKTNILESLSYFSNSSGLRGENIEKIVPYADKNVSTNTSVYLEIFSGKEKIKLLFLLNHRHDDLKKNFYFNDNQTSISNIKNYISFIWLTPHMDKIMYEGQSIKRNFIDKMISQNDKFFNKTLSAYKKDTTERLAILKNSKDEKWLNIIEKKLSENIFDIFSIRRKYALILNEIINKKLKSFKDIELKYQNKLFLNLEAKKETIELILDKLKLNRKIDEISKRTNFGINSDQIIFFDKKKEINTELSSTGEQKLSLTTIILANCWKLKLENKGFILLLDEATSHIDKDNFKKLFDEVDKFDTQIWYTGTSKNLFQVIENKGFFIHLQ